MRTFFTEEQFCVLHFSPTRIVDTDEGTVATGSNLQQRKYTLQMFSTTDTDLIMWHSMKRSKEQDIFSSASLLFCFSEENIYVQELRSSGAQRQSMHEQWSVSEKGHQFLFWQHTSSSEENCLKVKYICNNYVLRTGSPNY